MTDYPHVPAAFINAIAEEGTKAEAIEWLQKTWNEACALRAQLADADAEAERDKQKAGCDRCFDRAAPEQRREEPVSPFVSQEQQP